MSTTPAQSDATIELLGLNYPLYSDPTWDIYRAYGTGHVLMATKQAWAIVDGDGVIRWIWRSGQGGGALTKIPMPMEVLDIADELFGNRPASA